jgi:hypothetical protein
MTENLKTTPEMDLELEEFFALARDEAPIPSAGLLVRMADDAAQTQDGFTRTQTDAPASRMSWLARFFDDIGGLPAMGGLAACACAGVYLGFVNPDFATTWATASTQDTAEADGVMSHALLGDVYWIEEG